MNKNNRAYRPFNYSIQNNQDDAAIINIDGFIGRDYWAEWMTGEVSENTGVRFREKLKDISASKIIVNINSPGGDLNEGLLIKELLQAKKATIITNMQGFCASAATVIAQAGTVRRMSENSFALIHRVMFGLMGYYNQNSFMAMAADADVIDDQLIRMYSKNSKLSVQQVSDIMDEGEGYGRWMGAEEALSNGFVDEVYDPADEDDPNQDRLSGDEIEDMKRNVRELAIQGVFTNSRNRVEEDTNSDDNHQKSGSANDVRGREIDYLELKYAGEIQ